MFRIQMWSFQIKSFRCSKWAYSSSWSIVWSFRAICNMRDLGWSSTCSQYDYYRHRTDISSSLRDHKDKGQVRAIRGHSHGNCTYSHFHFGSNACLWFVLETVLKPYLPKLHSNEVCLCHLQREATLLFSSNALPMPAWSGGVLFVLGFFVLHHIRVSWTEEV